MQRFPDLAAEFDGLMTPEADGRRPQRDRAAEVRRAALVSKLLLNVFATGSGSVTAGAAGPLAGRRGLAGAGARLPAGRAARRAGRRPRCGRRPAVTAIGPELGAIEGDLVSRMHLREVLADPALAAQLTPSMSLIEQLLRDKANLSGVALANAKALIRRFVDEVAEVLRTQVRAGQRRHDRPLGAAEAGVPQPRPRPHHLEEPHQLEPGGRAALRRPALLPAHRASAPRRRG